MGSIAAEIKMRFDFGGLAAALLCVVLFGCAGCSGGERVYQAGLEAVSDGAVVDDERIEKRSESETDGNVTDGDRTEWAAELSAEMTEIQTEAVLGYVYVCGAVVCPGVYPVHFDMRVFEAIELAGGFSPEADEQWMNLAGTVQDGQRLYVYSKEETAELQEGGASVGQISDQDSIPTNQAQEEQKVNINTADRDLLMTLPGIGEAKAEAILQYREEHGGFGSIEEIQNISGIKTAVFSKIKDRITVQ